MVTVFAMGWDDGEEPERLHNVLQHVLANRDYRLAQTKAQWQEVVTGNEDAAPVALFVVALPPSGLSHAYVDLVAWLQETDLSGWTGTVIVDGPSEIWTKKIGRELIFLANQVGCAFPGRPLVEATGSLYNFRIQSMVQQCSLREAYVRSAKEALARAVGAACSQPLGHEPSLVVIHASSRTTSNTLLLWEMVRKFLGDAVKVQEISLRNGTVVDCRGCSYAACRHFGESGDCFYGGVMVEKVYPAVMEADGVILLCPNYNDAVSANIMAFFNRLTALFRKEALAFYQKRLYAIVVSGYSGGDIVAEQVLGAMNCNKNFRLPPQFSLIDTAHDPGSILSVPQIEEKAKAMAKRMITEFRQ